MQDAHGDGYEKKWLILAIMDGSRANKEPLGRVVINLADYAAEDDRATMSFTVAVNKALSPDVSESKMLITLGFATPTPSRANPADRAAGLSRVPGPPQRAGPAPWGLGFSPKTLY